MSELILELHNELITKEQEINRLKDLCNKYEEEHKTTFETWKKDIKENEQLHSIIKELDDYIDEHIEFNHDGDDYGYMEWYDTKDVDLTTFISDIKEILDKAGDSNE